VGAGGRADDAAGVVTACADPYGGRDGRARWCDDDRVRIEVSRSGGFAGIIRRGAVDTAHRADALDWDKLVGSVDLTRRPAKARPVPDRFVYRIVIDRDVDRQELTVGEAELTGPLRELVDRVLAEGARDS
jgi:hypothetical protein